MHLFPSACIQSTSQYSSSDTVYIGIVASCDLEGDDASRQNTKPVLANFQDHTGITFEAAPQKLTPKDLEVPNFIKNRPKVTQLPRIWKSSISSRIAQKLPPKAKKWRLPSPLRTGWCFSNHLPSTAYWTYCPLLGLSTTGSSASSCARRTSMLIATSASLVVHSAPCL